MSDDGEGDQVRRKRTFTVMREKIALGKQDSKIAASIRRRFDLNGLLAAADRVKAVDRKLAEDLLSCIAPVRVFLLSPYLLLRGLTFWLCLALGCGSDRVFCDHEQRLTKVSPANSAEFVGIQTETRSGFAAFSRGAFND